MNSLLEAFSELIGSLVGSLLDHKHTGKKIDWGRNFRLLGVGFSGVSILIFMLIFFGDERDVSGAICCAAPFFMVGTVFLFLEILRKNYP